MCCIENKFLLRECGLKFNVIFISTLILITLHFSHFNFNFDIGAYFPHVFTTLKC